MDMGFINFLLDLVIISCAFDLHKDNNDLKDIFLRR